MCNFKFDPNVFRMQNVKSCFIKIARSAVINIQYTCIEASVISTMYIDLPGKRIADKEGFLQFSCVYFQLSCVGKQVTKLHLKNRTLKLSTKIENSLMKLRKQISNMVLYEIILQLH